jgi:DeoR/GlpR family transcriptional regulator of sugar metabolism
VSEVGQATVAALAARFHVSSDTIRRDLDQLDADGVLIRTHGGAMGMTAVPRSDTGLDVRSRLQPAAKEAIGALAATLVDDGSAIMMNGGTTVLALTRHLRDRRDLIVATNNLRVPLEISPKVARNVYLFGGPVRLMTQTTTGPIRFNVAAGSNEHDIQCDIAFVAVGAVSAHDGYSTSNLDDAAMMKEMMARASRVAILADSSKFGRRLFATVADLGDADLLVTDKAPPTDLMDALRESGVEVLLADTSMPPDPESADTTALNS